MLSEARDLWHVAVRISGEDEVHEVRLRLSSKIRPRIKSRFLIPFGISLFDDASECQRLDIFCRAPSLMSGSMCLS